MSEIFNLLKNFKSPPKKHFVTVENTKIEVTLQEKLDIIRVGENNYTLKNGKPVRKQTQIDRHKFVEIENFTSDPYWPEEKFVWKQ